MVVNIFNMYFARFLFFSILLYNIEAKAYYDWAEPDDTGYVVTTEDTRTQTTTSKPNKTDKVESAAGWLTIENGILTTHFPETVSAPKLPDYDDALNVTTNKTDTIPWYDRHTWDSFITTTTARPVNYAIPHYVTTTTPSYKPWYHRNTTPSVEYRPWYLRNTTPRVPSWLPRTRRPPPHHYPTYPPSPRRTTTPSWYTATEKPDSSWYYFNTTWSSSSTTESVNGSSLNSNRNDTNQTTGEANPDRSCQSCSNPLNITINSKISQGTDGETVNYGTFVNFLKKFVGKIIPSAINIAPNSNSSNVAVASGNGNIFFYVYN